ncbi:MAG: phenylalanyl-tRNA synthetase subunit beta [Shimia sp.]
MKPARPWWRRALPWVLAVVAVSVIGGHIALWVSDETTAYKARWTAINMLTWAVILLPAWGVSMWLRAKTGGR